MQQIFKAVIALLIGTALIFSAGQAAAGDPQIDAAKASGIVGERVDGYLGLVTGDAEDALKRKVSEINNKRRALYARLARDTDTTLAEVARVAGEKQLRDADRGDFIMDDRGRWTRK
ncbi:MAG: YdbL family protein [Pseudomonadota bacterium]